MKFIYKTKSLKACHTNNDDNDKKYTNSLLPLNLVWTIAGDGSVSICIQKGESFKQLKGYWEGPQIF